MPFAGGPILTYVGLGKYRTVGATVYVGSDDVITIPADTVTDLATVPRIFWAWLPPHGAYERSAVLHDYLCVYLAEQFVAPARRGEYRTWINARDADGLFRRVMRESGVGFVTRWLMWTGVRWGALANPARRLGWLRDAPLVLAISAAVLAATGLTVYALDLAVHALLRGVT